MEPCEPHPGVAGSGWGVRAVFGVGFRGCGSLRSFLDLPGVLGCAGSPKDKEQSREGAPRAPQGQSWGLSLSLSKALVSNRSCRDRSKPPPAPRHPHPTV